MLKLNAKIKPSSGGHELFLNETARITESTYPML